MNDIVVPFGGRNIRVSVDEPLTQLSSKTVKFTIPGVITLYASPDEADWLAEQLRAEANKCRR